MITTSLIEQPITPQIILPNTQLSSMEVAKDDLLEVFFRRPDAFAHFFFPHILKAPSSRFHFLLYKIIKAINESSYASNIAIAAPRGNAKTQIMCLILPLWCAAFRTKKFLTIISQTTRHAINALESIKHELLTNSRLQEFFPEICGVGKTWRKDEIELLTTGMRMVALGSGKQIRGMQKYGGERPDLCLLDDLESDETVRTKARREDLEEWLMKGVLGMAGVAGSEQKMDTIICGTIIHPHSILSKLINPVLYPSWEQYKFQAVYKFSKSQLWRDWEKLYINAETPDRKTIAFEFFQKHKDAMLEGTEVLWPQGDPYYNLMMYKIDNGVRAFYSEKQCQPVDPSSTLFNTEKIIYFTLDSINIRELIIYGSLDAASGDAKKRGDLTSISTIGKDPKTGIIYVLDIKAGEEITPSMAIQYVKQMHYLYGYRKFGIDSDGLKLLKDFFAKEIPDLRLTAYDLRLQKRKRIDRLEPIISNGFLRIQRNQYELISELTFYPKSDYDDVLDGLEIAVRLAGQRGYRLLTY